jgi:hypothetical protein
LQDDRERLLAMLAHRRQLDPVDQAAHDRERLGLAIRVGQGSAETRDLITVVRAPCSDAAGPVLPCPA